LSGSISGEAQAVQFPVVALWAERGGTGHAGGGDAVVPEGVAVAFAFHQQQRIAGRRQQVEAVEDFALVLIVLRPGETAIGALAGLCHLEAQAVAERRAVAVPVGDNEERPTVLAQRCLQAQLAQRLHRQPFGFGVDFKRQLAGLIVHGGKLDAQRPGGGM
jgi:hypothetical protein